MAEMSEVQCAVHGTFPHKTDVCPICGIDPAILQAMRKRAEEQKKEERRLRPLLEAEFRLLSRELGALHYLGKVGDRYEEHRLLGAIDVLGRRFARLRPDTRMASTQRPIVCVPWIVPFAAVLEEIITVVWKKDEHLYTVRSDDAVIELIVK
jgi:hypothetical protein